MKALQAPEPVLAQLLAGKEKALADAILVGLEEVDDLKNERRVEVEKLRPGLLLVGSIQTMQELRDTVTLNRDSYVSPPSSELGSSPNRLDIEFARSF